LASLRAGAVNLWLKAMVKSKPLHLADPAALREATDKYALAKTPPAGVSMEIVDGPVKGEWHRVDGGADGRLIYYLHGGGYVFGSPKSHRSITFALAKQTPADVFSLNYRLAPEHPFPAAVDDAVAGYRWLLLQGRDPKSIVVAGDSAGGGLSLALMLSCKQQGLPMPACAVLYSPWTDLSGSGASLDANEKTDAMFKAVYIREGAKKYLGGAAADASLASPLFGDLSGLPPILIFASKSEVLLDDSARLHDKLVAAGVEARFETEDGVAHAWPIFTPYFPEAKKAVSQSVDFIRACLI